MGTAAGRRCSLVTRVALASISARHHQTARVGLVVKACAEAVRLWLESNAQTSLVRVGGHATEAAGEPRLTPLQAFCPLVTAGSRRLTHLWFSDDGELVPTHRH